MITGNEPANPIFNKEGFTTSIGNLPGVIPGATGLTIRQQFANDTQVSFADAWKVLVKTHPSPDDITVNEVANTVAEIKVMIADALIAELNRENK